MIAIKRPNGDLIWLDAVLSFQESYGSAVTKHQIESGSSISDHTIRNNPTFSVAGVVSAVAFNGGPNALEVFAKTPDWLLTGTDFGADFTSPYVMIGTARSNPLVKLLPDSIRQFVGQDYTPKVSMSNETGTPLQAIKDVLVALNRGFTKYDEVKKKYYTDIELLTLVEFDAKMNYVQGYYNCICTGVNFTQDAESGDALYPQMTFEGVRFVSLTQTQLPKTVANDMKPKAAEKAQKGNVSPTGSSTDGTTPEPKIARDTVSKLRGYTGGNAENVVE